jgi:hypothetical protein
MIKGETMPEPKKENSGCLELILKALTATALGVVIVRATPIGRDLDPISTAFAPTAAYHFIQAANGRYGYAGEGYETLFMIGEAAVVLPWAVGAYLGAQTLTQNRKKK